MSEQPDEGAELYGPEDGGWYTSNTSDWIPLCPQLSDSAIRLYWIMRSLVIEKRGPVRKLTLMELAYLLPKRRFKPGEKAAPSSVGRIRNLLRELTAVRLVTTPEGGPLKTSSRAKAAAAGPLRIRVNDRPGKGHHGPRNAFAALDAIRETAASAAAKASRAEAAREQHKKFARKADGAAQPGQISDPRTDVGQNPDPPGQNSNPRGQNSNPDLGADQEERDPPLSLPVHTSRSDAASVRPSVPEGDARVTKTDGGTGGGDVIGEEHNPLPSQPADRQSNDTPAPESPDDGKPVAQPRLTRPPGVALLLDIGGDDPRFLLTGKTLRDQAQTVEGMLLEGWSPRLLRHVITGRPLPDPITTTIGAIVSARLRAALASGPPPAPGDPAVPHQAQPPTAEPARGAEHSTTAAAERDVSEATRYRAMTECTGCGRPGVAPESDPCPDCLDWPACPACTGPTPRRVDPAVGGVCGHCAQRDTAPPTGGEWRQLVSEAAAAAKGGAVTAPRGRSERSLARAGMVRGVRAGPRLDARCA